MILIFIALAVALAAVLVIYLRPGAAARLTNEHTLPPPVPLGLFEHAAGRTEQELAEADERLKRASALKKRASDGDLAALSDAYALSDSKLYREVLESLVEQAVSRQDLLRALVSEIASDNGLRANTSMAELVIDAWKIEPTERSTAQMMHIAALSDDGQTYQAALEQAVQCWRTGRLPKLSAEDLIALIESQYWVLSSEARSSGAGFALRQKLAGVRRELTTAASTK